MTSFEIEHMTFNSRTVDALKNRDPRLVNWPVVYILNNQEDIYVGESLRAMKRLEQHLSRREKHRLNRVRIVLDDTFNKSACLDLESFLIRLFAGDGLFRVLNRNEGVTNAKYFNRDDYQTVFAEIFTKLKAKGLFRSDIRDIENSDLFKLSPFKALTEDQTAAVLDILEGIFDDILDGTDSTMVVQGDPGTGKTVIAIFLMKLLADIRDSDPSVRELPYDDSVFADFFLPEYPELLRGFQVGLVVPQQSLRHTIKKVFAKTPGLSEDDVLTPFDVGQSPHNYDLLIVDEAHRLQQRANQSSAEKNRQYGEINERLFGKDDIHKNQLDWIRAKSNHQLLLLDADQSVRPADLPEQAITSLLRGTSQVYRLSSQLRVQGGPDYIEYVKHILDGTEPECRGFGNDYDFVLFEDFGAMHAAIRQRNAEVGLSRVVAGFAWPWVSKHDKQKFDICLDGCQLRWNRADKDWINSVDSLEEMGSIHTVQGYDLNYRGVVIGNDLRFDPDGRRIFVDRDNYHDKKGKENNRTLKITYSDEDLLRYIKNIYSVLLTRGMRGTYVYVCDRPLREYFRRFFGNA
jgi:DUF2075 family protein